MRCPLRRCADVSAFIHANFSSRSQRLFFVTGCLMARANFDLCLNAVLKFEGGYSDHPADPGGATNFGITQRTLAAYRGASVSKMQVRRLTAGEAAQIYRRNYWDAVRGDELPSGVDAAMFDLAVNSGPRAAIGMLQQSLQQNADGVFGPVTLQAVQTSKPEIVISQLMRRRRSFLAGLNAFLIFGRGWSRRIRAIEDMSLKMAARIKI